MNACQRFTITSTYVGDSSSPTQHRPVISAARTVSHNTRGFLRGDFATDGVTPNADGFRQRVTITDFYLNSGVAWTLSPELRGALGLDFLAGNGRQTSENFEYAVFPDGRNRPDSHTLHVDEATALRDTRRFGGLYSEVQWTPTRRERRFLR